MRAEKIIAHLLGLLVTLLLLSAGAMASPDWYENVTSVTNGTEYLPGRNYGFQIYWEDSINGTGTIVNATFEFNGINYTQFTTTAVQNNTVGVYWVNLTDLPANETGYSYKWYANNTTSSCNSSDTWYYSIIKNGSNPVMLWLNGSQSNLTVEYGKASNATAEIVFANSGSVLLWRDGVAKTNPEIASLYVGSYLYKANTSGTVNYTANDTGVAYDLTVRTNGSISVNVKYDTAALSNVRVFLLKYGINASMLTNVNGDAVFAATAYNLTDGVYAVDLDEKTIAGYKKPEPEQVVWSVGNIARVNFALEKVEQVPIPEDETCGILCVLQELFFNFINWIVGLFGVK